MEKIAPLKQNGNDNICVPLDKFLQDEEYSEGNIYNLSILQQEDHWNCGVFALENAKAILNAVRNGNDDPAKVKESLKAVNKDVNHLNILRKYFANSLTEVSPINKQSSVAFSSSSEKGIEESIEQEPLHNTENISRENERGITSQKRQGKKNFDDGKSYQKGVVSYEELEKQTLGKLKEISRRYILTDDEKEKKLSDFVERQEKDKRKFNELWEGFVSLSNEEKKKAILRIFFFAEFWDSSQDENEGAFRNIVWNKLCDLNAQDYIFKESVDYLIPFVSNPLVSMHMYENNNRLQRVLRRAKSSLLNDEMGNLIIKICIEIFNMRNTFNRGEFIKSGKVVGCLSALKKFCEAGRKNKIADFELGDDQDCKIIYSLLGKKSKLNISSAIRSLIEEIKLKETEEKENTLEGFINDLRKSKKDLTQIYQCDQIKGFLKQHDYYLITFAIDEVIQYNESPLEEVLSIAKDHFSEEEMNAMLERACKYIVDQRNKSVEGVVFDSEKAFRLLSDKLNSINRKKEEILKFLVDKLGKIQDFSENCQSSTLQQTLEEVVSYSPSRGKNTGNRNHESCSKNFFDELTMILDGGKTDKQDKIQSFISSRLSRYKGNCFYRLLLGEFLFENQDHAQISQKYLLLHLDSQSIAFLLTAGQREKAKTTVLSIIDKSRGPVPNISSFAIDYRNLQIVNLEIDSRKSHLLDGIKKEDIEQGYKIKFIPINEEVISLDLLRKAIKDVGSRKQVIDNLKNIVNFINYTFNLDNDKIKFSFIRDESDAKNLVDGLLMGSKHEIPSDDKIINEIISSLVKNNIQAKSNNIRDHRLPIADKRSGKKDKKKAEYYAYLSREYGIFSSQADVRGDRATFNRSAIRKNRKRPIINEEDYGCNALHLAIANEKFDDVKKLIDANEGYVKGRDFYGNTPLHFAVQAKNLEILQFLMDYIEKQNQKEGYFVDKNCDGCTPLHFAARSGNVEFFSKLLKFVGAEAKEGYVQSKNNKGETPLHFAARSGKAEVVSKLLEFVDAKAKEGYVQSKNNKGETPLHFAAKSGNVKVVEKLLKFVNDKEGYVKHENSNKCTPLHFAAWGSNVEVINKLLEFVGAEAKEGYVQSKNNKGETPLHFAAKKNNVGVILSLIGCVTEREGKENYVKCTNKLLYTPLHFAARSGNVEVINKLLEFVGAEAKEGYVQSKNNKGETPLHFAARSGDVKAVERLLEYVNDKEGYVRAENNEKETSLHFAARSGNVEVINKLLEFVGAEAKEGYVQSKNNKGETPLHFAAGSGNVKAVEKLLQFVGENEKENYIEFANNDNKNALDIAISYGSWKVFYELLKYIKNPEQKQHYLDLVEKASDSKKRNIHSSDNLQTKGCVKKRKKQRNSEGLTSQYSKKRPRISDGNTQKPPVKKVKVTLDAEESTGGYHKEDKSYKQPSRSINKELVVKNAASDNHQFRLDQQTANKLVLDGNEKVTNTINEEINDEVAVTLKNLEHSSADKRNDIDGGNTSPKNSFYEDGSNDNAEEEQNKLNTSLFLAVESNNFNEVERLLSKGASINATEEENWTPLHLATRNGHKEVVEALLNKGADVNAKNKKNWTPLHLAAENGHKEVVEALLNKGADVNATEEENWTPLHLATENGHKEVVEALLNKGADVNATEEENWTPLHLATRNCHKEVVEALLNEGADVNAKDDKGCTPLHYAVNTNYDHVIKKLLNYGADINVKDDDGMTPLDFAIKKSNMDIVNLFLNNNTLKDDTKKAALSTVVNSLNTKVIDSLLKENVDNAELLNYLASDKCDITLLYSNAIKFHLINLFEFLLSQKGFDINAEDENGVMLTSYLHLLRCSTMVNLLQQKGVEIEKGEISCACSLQSFTIDNIKNNVCYRSYSSFHYHFDDEGSSLSISNSHDLDGTNKSYDSTSQQSSSNNSPSSEDGNSNSCFSKRMSNTVEYGSYDLFTRHEIRAGLPSNFLDNDTADQHLQDAEQNQEIFGEEESLEHASSREQSDNIGNDSNSSESEKIVLATKVMLVTINPKRQNSGRESGSEASSSKKSYSRSSSTDSQERKQLTSNDISEKSTNEGRTSSLGIKRLCVSDSDENKQEPTLDDSPRKNVDAEESVCDYQKGDETCRQQGFSQESYSNDSNNSKEQESSSGLPAPDPQSLDNSNKSYDSTSQQSSPDNSSSILEQGNEDRIRMEHNYCKENSLINVQSSSEQQERFSRSSDASENSAREESSFRHSNTSEKSGTELGNTTGERANNNLHNLNNFDKNYSNILLQGNTQVASMPRNKVAQSDSPRQEVKIKSNVGNDESDEQQDSNRESGSEISGSRSNSPDSQEGEQPTLNDVESNSENQEIFSRSSSTSGKNDNDNLSEESCSGDSDSSSDDEKNRRSLVVNEDRTLSSGTKRLRTSNGSTQEPPVKKVTLDDSLRQNVRIGESIDSHQKEDEIYRQQDSDRKSDSEANDSRSDSIGSQFEQLERAKEQQENSQPKSDFCDVSVSGNLTQDFKLGRV